MNKENAVLAQKSIYGLLAAFVMLVASNCVVVPVLGIIVAVILLAVLIIAAE